MPHQILDFNKFSNAKKLRNIFVSNVFDEGIRLDSACVLIKLKNEIEQSPAFNPAGFVMYDHSFKALSLQKGDVIRFVQTGFNVEISMGGVLPMSSYEVIHKVSKIESKPVSYPRFDKR